ncbi:MAG: PAS domain S-box protein, partial [bacterium]|nr:PAS domain S-box protein [bacterium]
AFFLNEHRSRKVFKKDFDKSRKMLQLVLDNIPQFVFWKDKNSAYLGCNKNFARVAGVEDSTDIVGKTDHELPWQNDLADNALESDRKVMNEDKPILNKVDMYSTKDGDQAWLNSNKIPLHDAEGNVVGILGTNEDITERINTENRLKESESKYRTLVENINVGIYRTKPEARGRFIHVNTELAKMLGYDSQEEMMNLRVEDT